LLFGEIQPYVFLIFKFCSFIIVLISKMIDLIFCCLLMIKIFYHLPQ